MLIVAPGVAHSGTRRSELAEAPKVEHTSVVSAGVQRVRTGLSSAGIAARRTLDRRRGAGGTSEMEEKPTPERTSVADEVQRIRTQLSDARIAAGRTLERIGWARVIVVGVIQVVIALVAWRLSVRRDRRRRQRVQLWVHEVLHEDPQRRRGWRRRA